MRIERKNCSDRSFKIDIKFVYIAYELLIFEFPILGLAIMSSFMDEQDAPTIPLLTCWTS